MRRRAAAIAALPGAAATPLRMRPPLWSLAGFVRTLLFVSGRDNDAAHGGIADTESLYVRVLLKYHMNDSPFLRAHGLHAHAASGLLGTLGEPPRKVFEGLLPPIEVPLDVDCDPFRVVTLAAVDHAVDEVLKRTEGTPLAPDEQRRIRRTDLQAHTAVGGRLAAHRRFYSGPLNDLFQEKRGIAGGMRRPRLGDLARNAQPHVARAQSENAAATLIQYFDVRLVTLHPQLL
jgi:hypothetical protein